MNRRAEGIPVLQQKALAAFAAHSGKDQATQLMALFADRSALEATTVHEFVSAFVSNFACPEPVEGSARS